MAQGPNRREALLGLGAATAQLAGCVPENPDCPRSRPVMEGPFYVEVEPTGLDIRQGKAGVPLRLTLTVLDGDRCAPLAGARVNIWMADANGDYSGFAGQGTEGETFLRGEQESDAEGRTRWEANYPGPYVNRTAHIHVKIEQTGDRPELTTQLYFPQALSDAVYAAAPYPGTGDHVRNQGDVLYVADHELALVDDGAGGYEAAFTLVV